MPVISLASMPLFFRCLRQDCKIVSAGYFGHYVEVVATVVEIMFE